MGAEKIFEPFEKALWEVLDMMREFALNYIFGILAIIFALRFFSGLAQGRIGVISGAIFVICGFLAVTMGQTFWTQLPIYQEITSHF